MQSTSSCLILNALRQSTFVHSNAPQGTFASHRKAVIMTAQEESQVGFMNLNPAEQSNYETVREQVGAILAQPNGLELILNAIVAQGPEFTIDEIDQWVSGVKYIDSREVAALCHGPERLLTVESTTIDL